MGNRAGGRRTGPKCIAIVGPFASGKTTLLEALLARTGAIQRQALGMVELRLGRRAEIAGAQAPGGDEASG